MSSIRITLLKYFVTLCNFVTLTSLDLGDPIFRTLVDAWCLLYSVVCFAATFLFSLNIAGCARKAAVPTGLYLNVFVLEPYSCSSTLPECVCIKTAALKRWYLDVYTVVPGFA